MKEAKLQIQRQLLKEMKTRNIYNIKVKHIVDALHISRSTFYLYYDSVFAVLQNLEDHYFIGLQDIAITFWSYPPDSKYLSEPHPIILKVMTYLRENKELSKVLWGPHGDLMFKTRCRKMIRHAFFPEQIFSSNQKENFKYAIAFMIGGHLELVNSWIDDDCSYNAEDLTLLVYRLMYGDYK